MLGALAVSFIAVFATVLAYIYWKSEFSSLARAVDLIPGPPKLPILGCAIYGKSNREILTMFQETWVKQYGRIYRVWIGWEPYILVSSPKFIQAILSSTKSINKAGYEHLASWLGDGLILAKGDEWKKARRLLTPAFHFKILDSFVEVFNRNTDILVDQLNEALDDSNVTEINVLPFMKRCTLDIICETAMGVSVHAQSDHDSEYIKAVEGVTDGIMCRFFSVWRIVPNWIYFRFSSEGREFHKNLSVLHGFTKKVIQDRKQELYEMSDDDVFINENENLGLKKKRTFLDLILTTVREGTKLSDETIQHEVDTFMFGGHDTTSVTVTMFLYCMATHPEYQQLVQDELAQVFGNGDRFCTMNDTSELKFMECCIKESLRLYPTVLSIAREISEDIELDGYKIPAGTNAGLMFLSLHRNAELFSDPLTYNPERFQGDQSTGQHPFAFVPFSAGPRNCIGQKFAWLEMKVILASLLRKFNFTYSPSRKPVELQNHIVLHPESGVKLIITPRY